MNHENTPETSRPLYLVSACLCGLLCRYDGGIPAIPALVHMREQGLCLPFCPETEAGLPTPRPPCELRNGRVLNTEGADLTETFAKGAELALALARRRGIGAAILKDRSPSCGSTTIYDGSFSGRRIPGEGVTAALLRRSGLHVYTEQNFPGASDFSGT